jgi:hypothetical protein
LARAGLIPALGKHPLSGKERCRVVSLTPGPRPLEALANVLARIMTNDPSPVEKTEEFERVLKKQNDKQKFEGLRRIASALPDINSSPLIILVDQFEEVYTYQSQQDIDGNNDRKAFVESLLCAASDRSQNVSVILTLRSDFLGKTQQNPQLNKLFASQGVLVAMMQPEQLAIAITEPARRAGYELDKATVNLLITESGGRDGALPLLQFALTQIWQGLLEGVSPADTLERAGGVGGALASKAKSLYDALTTDQQQIARSAFLSLIQLNDDNKATRRRARISELMTSTHDEQAVREVINRFVNPNVWILVTSSNKDEVELVEIAHESLINNWQELRDWLDKNSLIKLQRDEINKAAVKWKSLDKSKSKDYLFQGRILRDALEFQKSLKDNPDIFLSDTAKEFLQASVRKKRKNGVWITVYFVVPAIISILGLHFWLINRANQILFVSTECKPNPEARFFTDYLVGFGYRSKLRGINLCKNSLIGINLNKAELNDSQFQEADLFEANLSETSLENANLDSASLPRANLSFAFLLNTRLNKALLSDANLDNSNFIKSNLSNANFIRANIRKVKFVNVNFSNTNFDKADLSESEFVNPQNLNKDQLMKAKLCRTKIPSTFKINPNKDCL